MPALRPRQWSRLQAGHAHRCHHQARHGPGGKRCCSCAHAATPVGTLRPAEQYVLSGEQVQEFNSKGWLAIKHFASADECNTLKARANELVDAFDPETVTFFSSTNQEATTNDYFLNSAANISFFFEENSFKADGTLVQDKRLCINKCGHALHDQDDKFRQFSRSDRMQAVYRSLGFGRPLPVQSMYIFKQPKIGGRVVPHQDSSFLATDPLSCVGIWLAVEDATVDNGCLFIANDSHNDGAPHRMTRDGKGSVHWPTGRPDYSQHDLKPVETPKGTLVLLHGSNVHGSNANTSPVSRHAYSMHVVESAHGVEWLPDNWLQRPQDAPFQPLYDDTQ